MRYIIPISGKDSLATALVQLKYEPGLPYEYVFNPTGAELPEVFEWLNKTETYLGKKINYVGEDLISIIEDYNYFLPSRLSRYCTRQSKIEPFEKWIGKEDCIVYYGIRADEKRDGYNNQRYQNIVPDYPLKKYNVDINGVYKIIKDAGLKPPTFFWQYLFDEVCKKIGGKERLLNDLAEWQIDFLFCWRTRANCYFCFNQRKVEWVGLLLFHPELFENAQKLEYSVSEYFWNGKDYPLTKIIENKDAITRKHINTLCRIIRKIRVSKIKQMDMFETEKGFIDFFKTTSCGLFCGK
jgi:hypothetical protein